MKQTHLIGVVDDNDSVRETLELLVVASGHQAQTYDCAETLINEGEYDRFDCLILDFSLPGLNGLELINYLDRQCKRPATIVVSGTIDGEKHDKLIEAGVVAVLSKPVVGLELMNLVSEAIGKE